MPEDLSSQVLSLEESVQYQNGSVVSRQLIKKNTGNITVFAFDEGEGLTEHTSPFNAFVYIMDGEADITISGNPYHLTKGEFIIMPENQPHALKANKRFKMALIMIKENKPVQIS